MQKAKVQQAGRGKLLAHVLEPLPDVKTIPSATKSALPICICT